MDIKEYISSGILESYVLGALSKDESVIVEQMASKYPEVKRELDEIQESLNNYVKTHAKIPNPELKKKILDGMEAEESEKEVSDSEVVSIKRKYLFTEYLAAAAITFAVLSAGASYFFFIKWQEAENKVLAFEMQNAVMAQHNSAVNFNLNKELDEAQNALATITDSSTTVVELKGLPVSPTSKAVIFWNKNSKQVFISVNNLPAPPDDKQYQLWALQDGKPFDAGVFELDSTIQKMKCFDNVQAFAVTLEKKGGSPSPDLQSLFLMGEI